jgi:hypothetical protein
MEVPEWSNAVMAGLAIAIFIGGMTMMFTGLWTTRKK